MPGTSDQLISEQHDFGLTTLFLVACSLFMGVPNSHKCPHNHGSSRKWAILTVSLRVLRSTNITRTEREFLRQKLSPQSPRPKAPSTQLTLQPRSDTPQRAPRKHLGQLGAMNYVTNTSTDSRLYGNLPKTQIDLNRSMSVLA